MKKYLKYCSHTAAIAIAWLSFVPVFTHAQAEDAELVLSNSGWQWSLRVIDDGTFMIQEEGVADGDDLMFINGNLIILGSTMIDGNLNVTGELDPPAIHITPRNATTTGDLHFHELGSHQTSNSVGFKAPTAIATDLLWTLPAGDGTNGQVLSTNGSGILSWKTDSTGAAEVDPTVNDLGKATLNCTTDQIAKFDGLNWICADDTGGSGDNLGNHTATQNMQLNANWLSADGESEGIFIDDIGKVGVGTTNPIFSLQVESPADTQTAAALKPNLNTPDIDFDDDIRISGIKIWNPALSIGQPEERTLGIEFNSDAQSGLGYIGYTTNKKFFIAPKNSNFRFLPAVVVETDGNVGIGATYPTDKLEIRIGETKLGGVTVSDPDNTIAFLGDLHASQEIGELALYHAGTKTIRLVADGGESYFNGGGKLGIGTTTPNSELEVSDGYLELDTSAGTPPAADCDQADEIGRMKVDGSNTNLYVCTASGWVTK